MSLRLLVVFFIGLAVAKGSEMEAFEALGERLFNDHRFSQHFAAKCSHSINCELTEAEILGHTARPAEAPKRFAVSCASCHQVDTNPNSPMLLYADNLPFSPVPERDEDNVTETLRNTQQIFNLFTSHSRGRFFHHDGELPGLGMTVVGNFSGRHHGWLLTEKQQAFDHWHRVLKEDDGSHSTAAEFGALSYAAVFAGAPVEGVSIPETLRVDFSEANPHEIRRASAMALVSYMRSIQLEMDEEFQYTGSAYDKFLIANGIRRAPDENESLEAYTTYLKAQVETSRDWVWVNEGQMQSHDQLMKFGPEELAGLRVFAGRGQCMQCHKAPHFTDYAFHNVGISQFEYEIAHGTGSFARLSIPSLAERNENLDQFGIANQMAPHRQGILNARVSTQDKRKADLGLWNRYKSGHDHRDQRIDHWMQKSDPAWMTHSEEERLSRLVGRMLTPSLRNLGHSAPYFHNGAMPDIFGAVVTYMQSSQRARYQEIRNADPLLKDIRISGPDIKNLADFLRGLNEEYE